MGYLGNVDSGEKQQGGNSSSIYLRTGSGELGKIRRLGVSGRRSAAKTAAPGKADESKPARSMPPATLLLKRLVVLLNEPGAIMGVAAA